MNRHETGHDASGTARIVQTTRLGQRAQRTQLRRVADAALVGAAVLAAVAAFAPRVANAQTGDSEFPAERFRLSTDAEGVLDVEWAAVGEHLHWEIAAWFGYADDPLVVSRVVDGDRERAGSLVSSRVGGEVLASLALWDRFQLGIVVPFVLSQDSDDAIDGVPLMALGDTAVGNVRIVPKLALLDEKRHGIGLALSGGVTIPTGNSDDYVGDGSVGLEPELLIGRHFGPMRLGANLGYRVRSGAELANLEIDDEIFWHIGAGYRIGAHDRSAPFEITASLSGATAANDLFGAPERDHVEALGGAAARFGPVVLFAAAGVGLQEGFGTPDWRVLGGFRFSPLPPPPPKKAPKKKKKAAAPTDADGDGIPSDRDQCPEQPETFNNWQDEDGCPDEVPDTDGDGIADDADGCIEAPEDKDDFEDADGCPDPDNDGDGVADVSDQCPLEPGPIENRGCPDTDRDGDGVVDRLDNCPDEPGSAKNQGCKKKQLVVISDSQLEILDKVFFRVNKATIRPRSFPLLNNVADVLNAHTEIESVRVEGHTDSQGDDDYNLDLSQRRAEAVVDYLVGRGVARERLEPVGFGETRPIDRNNTKAGRAANRRVEFQIVGGAEGVQTRDSNPDEDTMEAGGDEDPAGDVP